ncbi:MAG TPA: right-handed parallel beta-helix repeat-containing protein [Candidatus Paceibacterota bacterium]|nr:right-handed parallel beta-helix repeat-containing protein [Candidatus Paceibacterota bacterium]
MKEKELKFKKLLFIKKVFIILFFIIFVSLPSFIFASTIYFPTKIDTLQERINIQVVLNKVMSPSPNLIVDGVLGRKSIQAIQSFQESRGLVPDGKVGPITRSVLESSQTSITATVSTPTNTSSSTNNTSTSSSSNSSTKTLTYNSNGCVSGAIYNAMTGELCTKVTTSLPAGCTSSTKYSPTTGVYCSNITTTDDSSTSGGGGSTTNTNTNTNTSTTSCTGSSTQFCTISNGTGIQSRTCNNGTWSTYGTCTVSTCNSGYQISGNTCIVIPSICTPESTSTTCSGKCGTQTNNCGSSINCGTCTTPNSSGNTYYVSTSGSDNNNGLSQATPIQTIAKVNTLALVPGDSVLFKRGESWHEQIVVNSSGSSTLPITYGAYGSGDAPVITGFVTLSSWTPVGNGVYQSPCPSCSSGVNMLTIDGIPQALGRYPNTGYLTFESHSGTTSITDNQLSGSPNWTGAEVVIKSSRYTFDNSKISSHSGSVLTFSPITWEPTNNFGYFIQRDEKTLDKFGEWYFDPSTKNIKVFFGSNNPSSYTIKTSTIDNLVSSSNKNYVTFDHLSFEGSNTDAFYISGSQYHTIRNCSITSSGRNAFYIYPSSHHLTIESCSINYSLNDAIMFHYRGSHYFSVLDNVIRNTGNLPGMGQSATASYTAIYSNGSNYGTIALNKIYDTGYIAINFAGLSNVVKNNFVDTFCSILDDGGGLYTYKDSTSASQEGSKIQDNIVLNGIGNGDGTDAPLSRDRQAFGIYLDGLSTGVEVSGNTVSNCSAAGMFINGGTRNTNIHDNTFFDNTNQILVEGYQTTIRNNTFFSRTADQSCLVFYYTPDSVVSTIGTLDYNYYARPMNDINIIGNIWSGVKYTLSEWRSLSNQDSHSSQSPKSITNVNDIRFEYNSTSSSKTVSLDSSYVDITGSVHSGSITLSPYTSIILIKQ